MSSVLEDRAISAARAAELNQPRGLQIYAPSMDELARQLSDAGTGIADALAALARQPTPARARQAAAQLAGAQACLQRLQAALREGGADGR